MTALSAFGTMVLTDGELMPWGLAAVLCFIIGVVSGIGSKVKRGSEPGWEGCPIRYA